MSANTLPRRSFLQALGACGLLGLSGRLLAQDKAQSAAKSKAAAKAHPLDPAIELARQALESLRTDVRDYEATLRKQERIGEKLNPPEKMFIRVRQKKEEDGKVQKPFAVYIKFLEPASMKDQEVLWIEGKNNNKLLGHQGGTLGRFTPAIWLDPKGALAMRGNRYSIMDVGLENLVVKLIEKGERDRKYDEVEVTFTDEEFDDIPCTRLDVIHPVRRAHFDFHIARIWIDKERMLPLRYAAYDWPPKTGGKEQLLEDYAYYDLKLNVGLEDSHFDEYNKTYGFH